MMNGHIQDLELNFENAKIHYIKQYYHLLGSIFNIVYSLNSSTRRSANTIFPVSDDVTSTFPDYRGKDKRSFWK